MAIAIQNTSTGFSSSGSASPLTFSHTVAGDGLWVAVESQGGDIITGVTWNGSETLTQAVKRVATADSNFVDYIYYLKSPTVTTANISISFSSTTGAKIGYGADYSGTSTTSQPDNTANSSPANGSSASQDIVTNSDNCWSIALVREFAGGGTLTAGTGSFLRKTNANDSGVRLFDSNAAITPAGTYTMNFNFGVSTPWNVVIASIASAGAVPTGIATRKSLLGVGI